MWNNEKFNQDLADGLEYETIVIEKIKSLGNNEWAKNSEIKGVDVLIWGHSAEIKRDNKSKTTWNYYFETECWGKPSWIYKYENVKLWVHGTDQKFSILLYEDLIKLIEKAYSVSWGDGWASRGKIIPVKKIEEIAIININL